MKRNDLPCLTVRRGYGRVEISGLSGHVLLYCPCRRVDICKHLQVVVCAHLCPSADLSRLVVLWFVASQKLLESLPPRGSQYDVPLSPSYFPRGCISRALYTLFISRFHQHPGGKAFCFCESLKLLKFVWFLVWPI